MESNVAKGADDIQIEGDAWSGHLCTQAVYVFGLNIRKAEMDLSIV